MKLERVAFDAPFSAYQAQVEELQEAWRAGDSAAVELIHTRLPKFLDERVPWLPKKLSEDEIRAADLDTADMQMTIARFHDFRDWTTLSDYVAAVTVPGSPVWRFEAAVEAVVNGNLAELEKMLRQHPELIHSRSTRVTHFDPPIHQSMLLHYIGANGVEGYRQKTPPNAVEVAKALLDAGAEPDAVANLYGGECTTMTLLVSSCHPAQAGLQVPLVDVLVDYGAAVEARGSGKWTSPLMTALAFGYVDAAKALVRRGARVGTLSAAAGLGLVDDARRLLETATPSDRHRALALAAMQGFPEIVELLLDAGEDPNRFNPEGNHAHSTPMHQAALAGHLSVVRVLVERGARTDIRDTIYESTPLGWAEHGKREEVAEYLRSVSAA